MWIDTHCHLDASEFSAEQAAIVELAKQRDVRWIVVPAVAPANFSAVAGLASQFSNCTYALGIHPIAVPDATEDDLLALRAAVAAAIDDPHMVAIGEIGLDFFVPELREASLRLKQEHFFSAQLKIGRDFDLPVLLHGRQAQDTVLKYLRRIRPRGGIAHAFNGSFQQADAFIRLGFKLGFGGTMTFPRALQIRRLASQLPWDALVLETDAPDLPPVWLQPNRNDSAQLPLIGAAMARLRGVDDQVVADSTSKNAFDVLPRLARLAVHSGA